ncbi:MAG: hypothetical protein Q7T74_00385 [Candidatus Saccharibacteria bacterium]|nr:hypothetical protein [Candidatus Saccharibacteria bacterium]
MFGIKKRTRRQPVSTRSKQSFSYFHGQASQGRPPRNNPIKASRPGVGSYWRLVPSLLALVACLATIGYSLYIAPTAVLRTEGAALFRPSDDYRLGINQILSGSLLNRSKLTFDSTKLEQEILDLYPEIAGVTVAVPLVGHTPVIGIRFADPTIKFVSGAQQMVLDNTGKVLPLVATNAALPVVSDESGIVYESGDRALSSDEVSALISVHSEILANDKKVASMRIGVAPKEFALQLEGESYYIKFKLDHTAREQVGALWTVLERLVAEGKKPATYIDVRLAERVFVL